MPERPAPRRSRLTLPQTGSRRTRVAARWRRPRSSGLSEVGDLTGKQWAGYNMVSELGRGGMAVVYKARQPRLDRYVAIKLLLPRGPEDPTLIQRFNQEARLIAGLRHPNIVAVHDFGEVGGVAYLVMEYVEGETLVESLGEAMEPRRALRIAAEVARALHHAHGQGIVHRDVKPSNILLAREDWALLSDFGIAKALQNPMQLTQTGTTIGTPEYMSPEQCRGAEVDARSDIYSLGVVLYEMLTGRPPFTADTPLSVMLMHVNEPLPPPREVNAEVPEALETICLRALAKDPGGRFAAAGEFADALEQALPSIPAPTVTAPAPVRAPATPPEPPAPAPAPEEAPPRRPAIPRPLLIAAAALLILAVVGLPLLLLARRGEQGAAPPEGPAGPSETVKQDLESGGNPLVVLTAAFGDIDVAGADITWVEVEAEKFAATEDALKQVQVSLTREGDTVNVGQSGPGRVVFTKLTVPLRARVKLETTSGGSVSIEGVQGGAEVASQAGDITLVDVNGPLRLVSSAGAIDASGVDGSVSADSKQGDVAVSGKVSGPSSFTAGSGSIDVEGIDGTVTANSAQGDISLSGRLTGSNVVEAGAGSIDVERVEGTITAGSDEGDITISGLRGQGDLKAGGSITVTGVDGTITAKSRGDLAVSGTIRGSNSFTTGGGSINVEGMNGSVIATSSQGNIRVGGRLTGENVVKTGGGSIEVAIPSDSSLQVTGTGATVSTDFDLQVSERRMSGNIGDGRGGTLTMESRQADVTLRRFS